MKLNNSKKENSKDVIKETKKCIDSNKVQSVSGGKKKQPKVIEEKIACDNKYEWYIHD